MRSACKKTYKVMQSLCFASLFFNINNVIAAENVLKKSPLTPEVGSNVTNVSATSLVQMIIALIFVLVAVVMLGWFSKRFIGASRSSGGKIKILSGTSVGSREKLMLIQVGEEQMLIGVAPGRVSKLHHFDNPVVEVADADPKLTPFALKLHQFMKKSQSKKKEVNGKSMDSSIDTDYDAPVDSDNSVADSAVMEGKE